MEAKNGHIAPHPVQSSSPTKFADRGRTGRAGRADGRTKLNKIAATIIALVSILVPAVLFCHHPARQIAGIALMICLAVLLPILRKIELS